MSSVNTMDCEKCVHYSGESGSKQRPFVHCAWNCKKYDFGRVINCDFFEKKLKSNEENNKINN